MTFEELFKFYAGQIQPGIGDVNLQPDNITKPIIPIPVQGGGEGLEGIGLGGRYGNLDLSKSKSFVKDMYTDELGPPGSFEFTPQELTGYYNPTLGNYQTFQGQNINPLLSNNGQGIGIFGNILAKMGLQPAPVGGFVPNSIRGYYDSFKDVVQNNKNIQQMPQGIQTIPTNMNNQGGDNNSGGGADYGRDFMSGSGRAEDMGSF